MSNQDPPSAGSIESILAARFRGLLQQASGGDEDAATELVRQYEPELRRLVRFWLMDSPLRRLIDSVDVAQSVFARFFVSLRTGQFDLNEPRQMIKLLITMARYRVADQVRRQSAQKRGGGLHFERNPIVLDGLSDHRGDPGESIANADLAEAIRERLSADVRNIIEQRLTGREWADLADEFNASPNALRKRCARAMDQAAAELGLIDSSAGE